MNFRKYFLPMFFLFLLSGILFAGTIKDDLKKQLDNSPDEEINAIVIYKSSQPLEVETIMKSQGVKIKRGFSLIHGAAVKGNKHTLERLAQNSFVGEIQPDYITNVTLDLSSPNILAPSVWSDNVTGKGVIVAVVDTGIHHHPAFENRIVNERDFTIDGSTEDFYGHGTHVAGIIASDDPTYKGVAPGASLINAKVLNRYGWGYTSDVIAGLDWAVSSGAEVISMSLGANIGWCDGNDAMSLAVDNAVSKGAIVVVAAGNSGSSYGTISSPGCARNAITVGAVDDGDVVAWFSSRGPTADGRAKPEIVAPGVSITSTSNSNGFVTYSGTSMATPHVSGAIALLLEANNSLKYHDVLVVLQENATKLGYDSNTAGAGRVDAYASYLMVISRPVLNESNMTNMTNKSKHFKNVTNRTKMINIPPGFLKNWPKLKGRLPDSSGYGLKRLLERLNSYLDTNADAACQQAIDNAELRLAEIEGMSNKDNHYYLDQLLQDYQAEMEKCELLINSRSVSNDTKFKEKMLVSSSMHKKFLDGVLKKVPQNYKSGVENAIGKTDARDRKFLNEMTATSPNFVVEYQLHEADKKINDGDLQGYEKEMQKLNARQEYLKNKDIDAADAEAMVAENTGNHLEMLLTAYESEQDAAKKSEVDSIIIDTLNSRNSVVLSIKESGRGLGKIKETADIEPELSSVPSVEKKNEAAKGGGSDNDSGGQGAGSNAGGNSGGNGNSGGSQGNSGNAPGHNK